MTLKEQLLADMKDAMKAKEAGKLTLGVIRMARAHIRQAEIDAGHKDFNDEEVVGILRKEMKQRKETLAEIADSGRQDLIDETKAEIAVLQKYLPAELSEDSIREVVQATVEALEPENRNLGSAMKAVMAKLKGKADGKVINRIVREVLAKA